ncbi:MAG: hypothetical protein ABL982_11405, partial [Vicinamibacterales bacterium]
MSAWRRRMSGALLLSALAVTFPTRLGAQPVAPVPASQPEPQADGLAAEIRRLQQAIDALHIQLAQSTRETADVRQALQALREQLEEERELLAAQVSSLEQTKVESGSKY